MGGASVVDTRGASVQIFDAEGNSVGGPLQMNSSSEGNQDFPVVALHEDGTFVAAWQNFLEDLPDDLESIQVRRFGAKGVPLAAEVWADSFPTGSKLDPAIAMAADGSFVVAWESVGSSGTDNSGTSIQGRRFLAEGNPDGVEFQVNTEIASDQEDPDVAMVIDGRFVVSWTNNAGSSERGARETAILYSLVETARINDIDPAIYLLDAVNAAINKCLLRRNPTTKSDRI